MSYFATDFFAGIVSAWAQASVVATSSQSFCHGSRSASARGFRLRGVVFDVLIGRKRDNHMVRSFPELVCAGEYTAGPGAQTLRRGGAGPVGPGPRRSLVFRVCGSAAQLSALAEAVAAPVGVGAVDVV